MDLGQLTSLPAAPYGSKVGQISFCNQLPAENEKVSVILQRKFETQGNEVIFIKFQINWWQKVMRTSKVASTVSV